MDEKIRESFARNLRKYMDADGRKQIDLGKYMGVSSATVSDWCNGKKIPRIDKINSIANWLGVDFAVLTGDSEPTETDAIIDIYRGLNDEGRKRALEYLNLLSLDPRNRKEGKS